MCTWSWLGMDCLCARVWLEIKTRFSEQQYIYNNNIYIVYIYKNVFYNIWLGKQVFYFGPKK